MANELKPPAIDQTSFDTIPYDAPLTHLQTAPLMRVPPEPELKAWAKKKANAGSNSEFLTVPPADLKGKRIIITGSNSGIGREAALQFAAWGANIVLGCRPNPPAHELHPDVVVSECIEAGKKAGHVVEVEWWPIDHADLKTVSVFAERWLETGWKLDVLCSNIGMGGKRPVPEEQVKRGEKYRKTIDGFEEVHSVNFLGHVLLILSLLPALAKAPEPRVVCTTSCFHYLGKFDIGNWNGEKDDAGVGGVQFYQNSKLRYQIWLTELQRRLLLHPEYRHITVNGCHPGYVNSGIWMMPGMGWLGWLKETLLVFVASKAGINSQQGSLTILHAATSLDAGPDPKVQGVGKEGGGGGGRYFNRIWEDEAMPHCRDADCRSRVWRKANDELKLQEKGLLAVLGVFGTS
ncbi:Retinol dehydrogenase [Lachnellula suecica]|uniref:Retinol dehydrogenase n=1 Tax=Lachnellula suecica TaxID=602035 RepID=A0A8T9BS39_9HELO|nr:Retinol dehydrogenase [Lachnellula suecica]